MQTRRSSLTSTSRPLTQMLVRKDLRATIGGWVEPMLQERVSASHGEMLTALTAALKSKLHQLSPAAIVNVAKNLPCPLDELLVACWTRLSLDQLAALSEGVCVAAQARDAKSHREDQRQAARVLFAPLAVCLTVDERGNAAGQTRMLPSLLNSLSPAALAADPRRAFNVPVTHDTQLRLFAIGVGFGQRSHEFGVRLMRWRRECMLASARRDGKDGFVAKAAELASLYRAYAQTVLVPPMTKDAAAAQRLFLQEERDWLRSVPGRGAATFVAAGRKSLDEFEAGLKLACTPTRKPT